MMSNEAKRTDGHASTGAAPDAAPPQQEGGASVSGAVDAELAAAKAEVADLKDRLLRAHAEMDNMRKRAERERSDTQKYAVSKFAADVLSVGDNIQRAIDAVPAQAAEQDPALKSFLDGVTLTERELVNVLERHGIRRMNALGEIFNPHLHQAMMEVQNPEAPTGTVLQVLQAGYTIEDRVLRPAMAVIAKGGPKADAASSTATAAPEAANDDGPPEGRPTGD
jgi:molecular chaperone GrpE